MKNKRTKPKRSEENSLIWPIGYFKSAHRTFSTVYFPHLTSRPCDVSSLLSSVCFVPCCGCGPGSGYVPDVLSRIVSNEFACLVAVDPDERQISYFFSFRRFNRIEFSFALPVALYTRKIRRHYFCLFVFTFILLLLFFIYFYFFFVVLFCLILLVSRY